MTIVTVLRFLPHNVVKCGILIATRMFVRPSVSLSHLWITPKRFKIYTVFQKSDAKIQITITTAYLIRIKYPLSGFNWHLSDVERCKFQQNPQHSFWATAVLKMKLKNWSFQYGIVALAVRTQKHQLQFVLQVAAVCTDTCAYSRTRHCRTARWMMFW